MIWPGAPASARAEGPRNPCGVARRPRASISTLHGVSSAFVFITDLPAPSPKAAPAPLELVVRDCRIDPIASIAIAGGDVRLASLDTRAHRVAIASRGVPSDPAKPLGSIDLAWAGDTVSLASTAAKPILLELAPDTAPDDASWIAIAESRAAVTDDTGAVTFKAIPAGTHHVVAWLPPIVIAQDVDVAAAGSTDVTIDLGAGAGAGAARAP
ncbi:MAG TPA: hypothetical protein VL463_17525 [Kofleriaceae bacterium]|nr:hypothetical protein [Kofleriaceae bacterium]